METIGEIDDGTDLAVLGGASQNMHAKRGLSRGAGTAGFDQSAAG